MNPSGDVTAVVVAMTDGEKPFLADCVASVIAQTDVAAIIVCVQESNQWIGEVLASVPADSRVNVLRLPLRPAGAIRNEAVKRVKTEWVAFCDGDDVWCKGKTLAQRAFAEKKKADFVASDHYLTDEKGRIRAFALAKYLPMTSTWLMRTRVMRDHPFREEKEYNGVEDHHWWFDTKQTVQKHRYPRMLLRYRVRGVSLSTSESSKARKARVVALGSKPVIGWGVLVLTACMWLFNRSESYRPLSK